MTTPSSPPLAPEQQRTLAQVREWQRKGRLPDAIAAMQALVDAHPNDGELWYELGYLLKSAARFEDALDAFRRALACAVSRPEEVHLNCGVLFSDHLRRDEDAERELHAALALSPHYVPALLNLGNLQEERGDRDGAIRTYERLLSGPPAADSAHEHLRQEGLARISHIRPPKALDDPLLQRLCDAAETQPDKTVRADLWFALGHAYDRLGAYELAFDAFAKANRWLLRQAGRRYDRVHAEALAAAMVAAFPASSQAPPGSAARAGGHASPQPLFVCGMYRSGSTLVEQVLAAHSGVTAGGELGWLRRLASLELAPFPQLMASVGPQQLQDMADEYLASLHKLFPRAGGRYITDKRPDNFLLIGLIKRLFPDARIVHTVRDPLDTGLSVFSHHLHPHVAPYAADLADIGHYYGVYRRLMAHWKDAYPGDIFDFDYDAFVAEPRPQLERLLDFLGLPWDDRCLEFHRLGNTVKTASYWQIRQPLHRGASGRWRHYAAQLQPLRETLGDAVRMAGGRPPADAAARPPGAL